MKKRKKEELAEEKKDERVISIKRKKKEERLFIEQGSFDNATSSEYVDVMGKRNQITEMLFEDYTWEEYDEYVIRNITKITSCRSVRDFKMNYYDEISKEGKNEKAIKKEISEAMYLKYYKKVFSIKSEEKVQIKEEIKNKINSKDPDEEFFDYMISILFKKALLKTDKFTKNFPEFSINDFRNINFEAVKNERGIVTVNGHQIHPKYEISILREKLLKKTLEIIRKDECRKKNFFIPGHPGLGKTNFLFQLFLWAGEMSEEWYPIYFNLNSCCDFDECISVFSSLLSNPIHCYFHKSFIPILEAIQNIKENIRDSLNLKVNSRLLEALGEKKLLILIDEGQKLESENKEGKKNYFKMQDFFSSFTRGNVYDNIRIVVSSLDFLINAPQERMISPFSLAPLIVQYFEKSEVESIVELFFQLYQNIIDTKHNDLKEIKLSLSSTIYEWTDGFPSLTMSILKTIEMKIKESKKKMKKFSIENFLTEEFLTTDVVNQIVLLRNSFLLDKPKYAKLTYVMSEKSCVGPSIWKIEKDFQLLLSLGLTRWDGKKLFPTCKLLKEYILHMDKRGIPSIASKFENFNEVDICRLIRTSLDYIDKEILLDEREWVKFRDGSGIGPSEKCFQFELFQILSELLGSSYRVKWEVKKGKKSYLDIQIIHKKSQKALDVELIANATHFGEKNFCVQQHIKRQAEGYWRDGITEQSVVVSFSQKDPHEDFVLFGPEYKKKRLYVMYVVYDLSDIKLIKKCYKGDKIYNEKYSV